MYYVLSICEHSMKVHKRGTVLFLQSKWDNHHNFIVSSSYVTYDLNPSTA